MSKRISWFQSDQMNDLMHQMEIRKDIGEEIVFYSLTNFVVGYTPFFVVMVTYEKKE